VWFVDLSAVRDPRLVEPAIATGLGATGELTDHPRTRELLLVLDNFEQVVDAAPGLGAPSRCLSATHDRRHKPRAVACATEG